MTDLKPSTKAAEYTRRWRLKYPERYKESIRRSNAKCGKESSRKYRVKMYKQNPRYYVERLKEWKLKKPERWRAISRRAMRNYRAKHPRPSNREMLKKHLETLRINLMERYIGRKFGRLTVTKWGGLNKFKQHLWVCRCDCGGERITGSARLNSGKCKSCGCLAREFISALGKLRPGRPPKRTPEQLREFWRLRNTIRRKTNTIEMRLRLRIREALKAQKTRKTSKLRDLLGCDSKHIKLHLESKFKPGMSWDNYGVKGWHIDHIRPCSSFDLTDVEEQKKCFHYTNLQPLWAFENIAKSNKTTWIRN